MTIRWDASRHPIRGEVGRTAEWRQPRAIGSITTRTGPPLLRARAPWAACRAAARSRPSARGDPTIDRDSAESAPSAVEQHGTCAPARSTGGCRPQQVRHVWLRRPQGGVERPGGRPAPHVRGKLIGGEAVRVGANQRLHRRQADSPRTTSAVRRIRVAPAPRAASHRRVRPLRLRAGRAVTAAPIRRGGGQLRTLSRRLRFGSGGGDHECGLGAIGSTTVSPTRGSNWDPWKGAPQLLGRASRPRRASVSREPPQDGHRQLAAVVPHQRHAGPAHRRDEPASRHRPDSAPVPGRSRRRAPAQLRRGTCTSTGPCSSADRGGVERQGRQPSRVCGGIVQGILVAGDAYQRARPRRILLREAARLCAHPVTTKLAPSAVRAWPQIRTAACASLARMAAASRTWGYGGARGSA